MQRLIFLLAVVLSAQAWVAQAGVFFLTDFVLPDGWALGLEPELVLDDDSGLGIQGHFKKGISDLVNASVFVGTGNSVRRFRSGGTMIFDFFPEGDSQPGIGLAAQGGYYRRLHPDFSKRAQGEKQGVLELSLIPYIHKSFARELADNANKKKKSDPNAGEPGQPKGAEKYAAQEDAPANDFVRELDPFVAVPVGWNFADSHYQPMAQFVLGLVMKFSPSFHGTFELDMPIQHAVLTVSGGVAYFY